MSIKQFLGHELIALLPNIHAFMYMYTSIPEIKVGGLYFLDIDTSRSHFRTFGVFVVVL